MGPDLALWPQMGHHWVGSHPRHPLQMADIVEVSRISTLELQNQLDEYKEKNRRELAEMQRQLKEKTLEAEKSRLTAMRLQDEVMPGQVSSWFTPSPNCPWRLLSSPSRRDLGSILRPHLCLIVDVNR